MADLGVASRTDMKEHADMIANLDPTKILIADMDTGYGGESHHPNYLFFRRTPVLRNSCRPHHDYSSRQPVYPC